MSTSKKLGHLVALVVIAAGTSAANATVEFDVGGLAGTGVTAHVWFTYTSTSATSAALTVAIENTTTVGGRISAFALNMPSFGTAAITSINGGAEGGGVTALAALDVDPEDQLPANDATDEAGWFGKWLNEGIKTPNAAGDFDFGVMNADSENAFITDGIGSGPRIENFLDSNDMTTFTLSLEGSGLQSMTDELFEDAFMSELSSDTGFYNFAVRFQGVGPDGEGSDLATTVVPLPGAAALAAMGLGLVGWVNRRRQ